MTKPETLQALLADLLPQLDDAFSKGGKPVSERPMEAARFVVDHIIVDIKGDTKDDYLRKPWFASIYRLMHDWFTARYGDAQVHPKRNFLHGVIKHYGALYTLRVPLTVAEPQSDGTCWVTFAKDVMPGEDPTSWIIHGPLLANLGMKPANAIRCGATGIAKQVRGIANDLRTANLPDDTSKGFIAAVLCHLDKAAGDMCGLGHESASLAVWELQMACEKVIKAYLTQEGIPYPKIHDLRELNRLAPSKHDWSSVKLALGNFPSERRVIDWRHHEMPAPTISELWRFYGMTLQLCSTYASRMARDYVFNNFSVHLRKPPWV